MLQTSIVLCQTPNDYTRDINKKLRALSQTSPDVPGGYITNNSYEGLKGGPCLFDSLVPVLIRVKEIDNYISVNANLDLKNNSVLYKDPESGLLYSIPLERVVEIIAGIKNDTLIFRTTENKLFDAPPRELTFIQVLKEGPNQFIKIPFKILVPADYTGAYTAKRRYDEYRTENDYFVLTSDNIYKKIKLTKNSLIKIFPDRKEKISESFKKMPASDKEKIVLSIL